MKLLPIFLNPLTFFVSLFLGLLVLKRNPGKGLNRHFASLAFFVGIWGLSLLFYEYPIVFSSLEWLRIVYVLVFGIVFEMFYLSYIFPEEKNYPPRVLILIYLLTTIIFTYIIIFTDLHIFKVIKTATGYKTVVGLLYPLYPFALIVFSGIGFINYAKKYAQGKGIVKTQALYLLYGLMIFSFLATIFDAIIPLATGNSDFFVLSPATAIIFIGCTAYAIIKHRLLDIRLVVARSVAYSLLIIIISIFYAAGFFFLSALLIGPTTKQEVWISTFLALIVAFSFQPLRHRLEKFTDSIFYKNRYDTRLLLEKLGRIMASYISLEELTSNLLTELFSQVKISQGALLLLKDKHIAWVKTHGYQQTPEFDEEEMAKLINNNQTNLILFEELAEGEIKDILRRNDFSLIMPLTTKQEVLGLLVLGEKASGDIYSTEDLGVFEILAPQMAVAIQNSLAYEEIRRFSTVLQEEVKRATTELQNANEKLKELDKLKDEFVSIASHELRTPMTAIKSYLWMALNKAPQPFDAKTSEYLDIAFKSTDRLIKLVQDMLTVSRIEGKRLVFNLETLDLSSLAQQIFKELKIKAEENQIQLSFEADKPLMAKIDKTRIMEVMENLLGNALKFTPANGKITMTTEKVGTLAEVRITDTGPGIAAKDQERLFQKFSRLDNTQTTAPGTGLGLYIAKQIVTLHGGQIWVKSKIGVGSTFVFSVPLADNHEQAK